MEPESFEIIGTIRDVEIFAAGQGVIIREFLRGRYGGRRWRKMMGTATVKESKGAVYEAEIHWFEAHGVGRVQWKIKKPAQ